MASTEVLRTDIVLRDPNFPNGQPIAIWDVKTGAAQLEGWRVREIRYHVGVGREVPVIELHIGRGVTIKAHATISARLWNLNFSDNLGQLEAR